MNLIEKTRFLIGEYDMPFLLGGGALMFAIYLLVTLRTGIARIAHVHFSRSEEPSEYWILAGLAALVLAAIVGLNIALIA